MDGNEAERVAPWRWTATSGMKTSFESFFHLLVRTVWGACIDLLGYITHHSSKDGGRQADISVARLIFHIRIRASRKAISQL